MRTLVFVLVFVFAGVGCSLSGDSKDACVVQADCLDGFVCMTGTCVVDNDPGNNDPGDDTPGPGGDDDNDGSGDSVPNQWEYGTFEAMEIQTAGMVPEGFGGLIGLTTAGGNLGCAMVKDESAAPGVAAGLVYARVADFDGSAPDSEPCPEGVYSITSNTSSCGANPVPIPDGCAHYKRWDATGKQIARRLAVGGVISFDAVSGGTTGYKCNVEISVTFSGGAMFEKAYSYEYTPGISDSVCVH